MWHFWSMFNLNTGRSLLAGSTTYQDWKIVTIYPGPFHVSIFIVCGFFFCVFLVKNCKSSHRGLKWPCRKCSFFLDYCVTFSLFLFLFLYPCYYLHTLRDTVSPVCGSCKCRFFQKGGNLAQKLRNFCMCIFSSSCSTFLYWCYYLHTLRESESPVCRMP